MADMITSLLRKAYNKLLRRKSDRTVEPQRELDSYEKEYEEELRQLKIDCRCSIASVIISTAAILLLLAAEILK